MKQGDRISKELVVGEAFSEGVALLAGRLERDCRLLAQRIPGWGELSANQQAALLSFSSKVGPACGGAVRQRPRSGAHPPFG